MNVSTISPEEAKKLIAHGAALIDIREPDEHARENNPEAHLLPLSAFENGAHPGPHSSHDVVIFHYQSGICAQPKMLKNWQNSRAGPCAATGRGTR